MQPLLLTLDKGYFLTAAPPDLEHGVVPLGPPAPMQPPILGHGVALLKSNTIEDSTHGHHQMVSTEIRLIIFFAAKKWASSIQSAKTRLGADCGSDHEVLIAKFKLKLKKVGENH